MPASKKKPCPKGQRRSPATSRCKKASKKSAGSCGAGKARSRATGRCHVSSKKRSPSKKRGSSKKKKPCPRGQAHSRETGRCHLIRKPYAPCEEGKARNRVTNRCRWKPGYGPDSYSDSDSDSDGDIAAPNFTVSNPVMGLMNGTVSDSEYDAMFSGKPAAVSNPAMGLMNGTMSDLEYDAMFSDKPAAAVPKRRAATTVAKAAIPMPIVHASAVHTTPTPLTPTPVVPPVLTRIQTTPQSATIVNKPQVQERGATFGTRGTGGIRAGSNTPRLATDGKKVPVTFTNEFEPLPDVEEHQNDAEDKSDGDGHIHSVEEAEKEVEYEF